MSVKERLKFYLKEKNISQAYFAEKIGVSSGYVNAIRTSIQPDKLADIKINFSDLNIDWLLTGKGEMISMQGKSIETEPASMKVKEPEITYGDGKPLEKKYKKIILKIPAKTQLGLQGRHYAEELLYDLEQRIVYTEEQWSGRYFDIEAVGESMDSKDPETAILEGDEIRVREIPKVYWQNKLHFHEWAEFTFFHLTKGFITKHVLEHIPETGAVLVNSYNPDKERFPDEWINLKDCAVVGNVISVTRPRGFKRRINRISNN